MMPNFLQLYEDSEGGGSERQSAPSSFVCEWMAGGVALCCYLARLDRTCCGSLTREQVKNAWPVVSAS